MCFTYPVLYKVSAESRAGEWVPGRYVLGYVCNNVTLKPLTYKLNGFLIFILVVLAFVGLMYVGIYPVYLYNHYWGLLISANALGLSASVVCTAVCAVSARALLLGVRL